MVHHPNILLCIQSCPNCSAYSSHSKTIDFFGMKLFWIHKNVPLGIGNTYIWGFFHFIHPQGLIDKISSIKFVFGLMSKQNQLQPNQMWFSHWNTYKRFMLVAFWQISKFCLQSPFWCPNFNKKLSNFDFQTPWIHFGPPRTHSINQPVLNDKNSLKWEKMDFEEQHSKQKFFYWWNVFLMFQNVSRKVPDHFLTNFHKNMDI